MGCDLEDVLNELKKLKDMAHYWFQCRDFEDGDLNDKLNALEQFLRDKNEESSNG